MHRKDFLLILTLFHCQFELSMWTGNLEAPFVLLEVVKQWGVKFVFIAQFRFRKFVVVCKYLGAFCISHIVLQNGYRVLEVAIL